MKMRMCEECGKPGGTVPKYYWDDVVAMLHDECAEAQMKRYFEKRNAS